MLTRLQKEDIVKNLTEKIKSSKAIVFADYRGVKTNDINELKSRLKKEGTNLNVIKKNLIEISLKNAEIEVDVKSLAGQLAITISDNDEVAPARILSKFAKENENLKILGGVLGVKGMSAQEVDALAKLPSKEEMLAKLVGTLNAPISGFVNVLAGNMRGLVNVVKAIADSKA
ncbi:MAG: 50S ribosomal protein L10 [Candidatus Moranbacteria bacterium GW2011_GWE1_35_17]|nr:MAG: 50S ribosomal protein L10 [Candidatus Moranbacteria bacterium GW2011_GWE1_35_17]KKP73480.1 MAG: 50S ribosomal protein L10 [Candidatus Moranbacteria bacterium GW2011_GWE2_35_164]KKP83395.1 MAG: 50S ribosomal protein L10 [Candidatus Moranbacteria bacterium GW2011_GWF1_35_5]KKP85232.1 MAG: 50S ribosomal protein L10 [Candidatus Moranbacteria bacterium GW2011_GWF2_35_54]